MASEMLHVHICNHSEFDGGDVFTALREGVINTDRVICQRAAEEGIVDGSTLVAVFIIGEELYVANLGDSEALLGRRILNNLYEPILLSFKHKPTNDAEKERITNAGAPVVRGRIFGNLAVSRALGDHAYKRYVISEPYLNKHVLKENDEFFIVACDGLWDVLSYQQVVDIASENLNQGKSCTEVSKILAEKAYELGSTDNISVIVVSLKWTLYK
eukprot:TRINITY_DN15593_c0_g1_i1.p1 TRINITY_DN15593_c0_g1~~TRINITY_DN15593_c0_g1_i1.p1  ORF type:complete len:234 (+),score=37.67 TRINITY_DN15593_c0_g1_i1:59-703(+)